jgi:aryl-alcohol dehydrogenase-like predicted oxidoreductase
MKRVELGRTGQTVSQVSLGCMVMGTLTDERTSARILNAYLDAGGDFLDTADCYAWWTGPDAHGGESEELLGRLLSGNRDRVFLATKVSARVKDPDAARASDNSQPYYEGAGADVIRRGIDASLRRLRTDHVDLYYIHVDDLTTPLEETLQALDEIVRAGKVRYIGWSNVRTWRLERIRAMAEQHGWVKPVAVQQQHSYLRPAAGVDLTSVVGDDMLHYLRANEDIALIPYSPILRGIYDDEERRVQQSIWQKQYAGPDSEARLANVAKVARELGVTGNQVALAWLLHQDTIPIIGPRTWDQWEAYTPAFDLRLSDEHQTLLG